MQISKSNKFLLYATVVMLLIIYCYVNYEEPIDPLDLYEPDGQTEAVMNVLFETNEINIFLEHGFDQVRKADQRKWGIDRVEYEVVAKYSGSITGRLYSLWSDLYDLYRDTNQVTRIRIKLLLNRSSEICTWLCDEGKVERITY